MPERLRPRPTRWIRFAAAAALVAASFPPSLHLHLDASAAAATPAAEVRARAGSAERRYRIIGKLRLALFWLARDDVGTARMTWRSDGTTTSTALLVGSDPERAPRGVNEWGYLREEIRPDGADVFTLRSLDSDDRNQTPVSFGDGGLFSVSCAAIDGADVNSVATTVDADGITYRMFDQFINTLNARPQHQWVTRRMGRPAGADAGFLTALERLIRLGGAARPLVGGAAVSYVYNNTIYDLAVRSSQIYGPASVGSRTFARLDRRELAITNRTTHEVTRFGVTYDPDETDIALPVQIFFQPSFWIRIELRLDDGVDAPLDPAADTSALARIRTICDAANASSSHLH